MSWTLRASELTARGAAVVLRSREAEMSYAELGQRSSEVEAALLHAGVRPGDPVAIASAGRGHDEAVGLVGVLSAGAVAVPLDVGAPPRRLAAVLGSTGCRAVVIDAAASPLLDRVEAELADEGRPPLARLVLGGSAESIACDRLAAGSRLGLEGLACILHTSGSTGRPKPVPVTWEGLDVFTSFFAELIGLSAGDRVLRVAELIFDLAWFDHLATLRAGATLLTIPRRQLAVGSALVESMAALAPTVIYGVPSLFMKVDAALPPGAALAPSPRAVLYAGEVFPPSALASFSRRVPEASLYNLFGPTETNVCTYHTLREVDLDGVSETPIGAAVPYAECALVDEAGAPVDGAGVGELVVAGPTALGGGPHPTRDRVERGADGLYYYRGRLDRMVKIRGFRVDPGDVEAWLARHPAVRQAAVIPAEDRRLGRILWAHVALNEGASLEEREARRFLAESLPPYMVPDKISVVDALPTTSTGKIDYAALA